MTLGLCLVHTYALLARHHYMQSEMAEYALQAFSGMGNAVLQECTEIICKETLVKLSINNRLSSFSSWYHPRHNYTITVLLGLLEVQNFADWFITCNMYCLNLTFVPHILVCLAFVHMLGFGGPPSASALF